MRRLPSALVLVALISCGSSRVVRADETGAQMADAAGRLLSSVLA